MSTSIRTSAHTVITAACVLASNSSEAQSVCDELSIDHVWYGAFTDTAMEIGLLHGGSYQFNYPVLNIVDNGSDTITVNYLGLFVLPWGNSIHSVTLLDDASLPASPFTGQVLLNYAAFPGDSVCEFDLSAVELCPTSCATAWIHVYQPGTPVNATLYWTVRDTASAIVASGDMLLNTTDHTQEMDSLCLVPGHYTIEIEQSPFETPAPFVGTIFRSPFYIDGPTLAFTGLGTLAFDWFPACFDGPTGIEDPIVPAFGLSLEDGLLSVSAPDGNALGSLMVQDVRGAMVHASTVSSDRVTLDLTRHAPGVYLISRLDKSRRTAQRFILH